MTTEHVLTPNDRCPCGQPQTGSGYCSYECYSKHDLGAPVEPAAPASMGEPLSEAHRLAEIRTRLDGCGRGPHGQIAQSMQMFMHAPVDIEFLLGLVGVLEGQLATARALLAPFTAQHRPCKNMFRTCVTCRDGYGEPLPWPCRDAKRLGLVTTCPACSDWVLRGGDAHCPSCDADLTALALGLDGGGSDA